MQNVWLMGVAQKCLCLSLLINNQPRGSLSQASLISSDLELREMYNIKATERQRQQKKVNLCCFKPHYCYSTLSNVGIFSVVEF